MADVILLVGVKVNYTGGDLQRSLKELESIEELKGFNLVVMTNGSKKNVYIVKEGNKKNFKVGTPINIDVELKKWYNDLFSVKEDEISSSSSTERTTSRDKPKDMDDPSALHKSGKSMTSGSRSSSDVSKKEKEPAKKLSLAESSFNTLKKHFKVRRFEIESKKPESFFEIGTTKDVAVYPLFLEKAIKKVDTSREDRDKKKSEKKDKAPVLKKKPKKSESSSEEPKSKKTNEKKKKKPIVESSSTESSESESTESSEESKPAKKKKRSKKEFSESDSETDVSSSEDDKKRKKQRTKKPTKGTKKKTITPYNVYTEETFDQVKEERGNNKKDAAAIKRIIKSRWAEMSDKKRAPYKKKAEELNEASESSSVEDKKKKTKKKKTTKKKSSGRRPKIMESTSSDSS